jgi:Leucine-rich repeat (LRR) protein
LERLRHLQNFNVNGADFEVFPKVISSLKSLESFSFEYCGCGLHDVFETLAQLPDLKKLYFSHCEDDKEDALPESFRRLQSLEEICFKNWSGLKCLPEFIGEMPNLRVIDLGNYDIQLGYKAKIQNLPESLGSLPNLEVLNIFGCQDVTQLPASFAQLSTLKGLDIIHSGITELHLTDEQWRGLESVRIQGPLPDLTLCANLKKFAWFKSDVSQTLAGEVRGIGERVSLPLACLHNLENLQLYGGTQDNLDFLENMPKLHSITLSCDFERLPESLGKLKNLEYISIFGAKSLKNLPESLAGLESLK